MAHRRIEPGSVWRFKPGRGDPARRLRVLSAGRDYVTVSSTYGDRGEPRQFTMYRSTLLGDYRELRGCGCPKEAS